MADRKRQAKPEPTSFEQVLQEGNRAGHFLAAILATGDGLPIATAQAEPDAELTAAMVALLQKVSKEARRELGMAELDEVTVLDREKMRLVCRFFRMEDEDLILALMVRPRARYRRASTWAIGQLQQLYRR
jgi:predicted regulator of Ras-like GTPase activity (Roadblock/LC7/MglB family)